MTERGVLYAVVIDDIIKETKSRVEKDVHKIKKNLQVVEITQCLFVDNIHVLAKK